jgi:3D-(3,5/4)-trihydroxycyclohexane-1,2-dione acylhydrolase (decyclizing)
VTARRLTTAQALVEFLAVQRVERDGVTVPLFAGVLGIFGHGNVAGVGQALQQHGGLRYVLPRNEQAMVHTAVAYAKHKNRLQTWACTSSIGPGATNMVTGAALATINRLPVLLLPGDIFATRRADPVLQQLELPGRPGASVNDAFQPVSRFFDRILRPEQLPASVIEAMRVLTDQAETGAATIALPQDVQAEAHDFPVELFSERVWRITRPVPDGYDLDRVAELIRHARRPLIVAGGGVIYSDATEALVALVAATGIPVAETQAGKGSLPYDHPSALGAIGATGTLAANTVARDADLVVGIGTRFTDFTTASRTAFQDADVRFVSLNVASPDAHKLSALPLIGDARAGIDALGRRLADFHVDPHHRELAQRLNREWDAEVVRVCAGPADEPPSQAAVIAAVNASMEARDVVVCAAGSMPGDLHKLWRTRDPKGYHVEYGYSCMGYEVAGGLGVKLADPDREVVVMVGDGSWLMMSSEIATSVQEGVRLTVVLIDNHGYGSIGGLSRSVGSEGFGTAYRSRGEDGLLSGPAIELDLAANARSLGADGVRVETLSELTDALAAARTAERTTVIVVECDPGRGVGSYDSWWDVPVAEASSMPSVQEARAEADTQRSHQRPFVGGGEHG